MIESSTLSDIIMRNTDIDVMQKDVFLSVDRRTMNGDGNNGAHPVGGTPIPIDKTALFIATISTEYLLLAAFGIFALVIFAVLYYAIKRNSEIKKQNHLKKISC
jgi:hypothetical protein